MAAPTYAGATIANGTDAGGAWGPFNFGDAVSGRICILQILQDGATNGAVALTSATDVAALDGTPNAVTAIPGPNGDGSFPVGASGEARQFLWIGRATSNVSLATASGTNSTSEDLYYHAWVFYNVSTGTTLASVIENGTAGATVNVTGTSNTAADASVQTLGPDRLALNFLAINDDNAFAGFTGQSGGTWTLGHTVAEASGTDGATAMLYAAMATAGTIDGGTGSITDSDAWGVVGFALIGTTVESPPRRSPYPQLLAH